MTGEQLYGDRLKALAAALAAAPSPHQALARQTSPLCGDRVDVGLTLRNGRIDAIGGPVRGCLLCRASASLLHSHAHGLDRDGLDHALTALREYLSGRTEAPLWPEWAAFLPARPHKSRHGCITLPLETALSAFDQAAPRDEVHAIILAAGQSSRMGDTHKLALPWQDGTVLRHVAATVSAVPGIASTRVVLGPASADFAAGLEGLPVATTVIAHLADGMAASLRAGMATLPKRAGAVLICLGDMPLVTATDIAAVVQSWQQDKAAIIRPSWNGRPGHPVLFHHDLFGQLRAVQGDQGARTVIAAHAADIRLIPAADDGVLADLDTPADYQAALDRLGQGGKG